MKVYEYFYLNGILIKNEYHCASIEVILDEEIFFQIIEDEYLLGEYMNNVSKKEPFSFLRKLNKHQEKKIERFLKNENL